MPSSSGGQNLALPSALSLAPASVVSAGLPALSLAAFLSASAPPLLAASLAAASSLSSFSAANSSLVFPASAAFLAAAAALSSTPYLRASFLSDSFLSMES